MPTSEANAPALSTPQTDETFTYAKVNKAELKRDHLGLGPGEDYTEKLHDYYSLKELATFLDTRDPEHSDQRVYSKVTLQFPDSLICDSAAIVQSLQKMLPSISSGHVPPLEINEKCQNSCCGQGQKEAEKCEGSSCNPGSQCTSEKIHPQGQRLWILADTSYSACCIDEVAAEHVGADLVVHFGDACLNPVASITSAYVFGKPKLDLQDIQAKFRSRYPVPSEQTVVLMADAPHTYLLQAIAESLPEYTIITADLHVQKDVTCIGYRPQESGDITALGRLLRFPQSYTPDAELDLSTLDLFHVTVPEAPRLLQLTTQFSSVSTYHNGTVSQGPFPNLMRRYRYMHMARSAGTIGILVNTLSLANTKRLIRELSSKIKSAGKKHYLFVVGKPNVAKLANFEAVDLWCVLGCDHQGIVLDQTNEYFKPIVTPYELLLAIGDEFSWTGKWVTDFQSVLTLTAEEEEENETKNEDVDVSDEEPEFDPVSGRFVNARPLRRLNHLQITQEPTEKEDSEISQNSSALVKKLSGAVAFRNTVSTSAAHLQTREWTGLGSDWTTPEQLSQEGAEVVEGDIGIARGYSFDTKGH